LNMLKSFGTKGSVTRPNPGTVISIVGALGVEAYVDASAIPNVSVLYVGTTNISSFVVAILF
jgi:hypothetical protein